MRNCIILGSGRSGTSMVAGCLASAGYYMGDELYPARGSNPKGFFEGPQINGINEALLSQVVPDEQGLRYGQRWLANLTNSHSFTLSCDIRNSMLHMLQHVPYCFKDPRFSYTLPAWLPYFSNTVYVCVFREPGVTAESIVKECAAEAYLSNVHMTRARALGIWNSIYNSIVNLTGLQNNIIYVHYSQMLSGEGLHTLATALDAPVDTSFPDAALRRSNSEENVPVESDNLYNRLCRLSGYHATDDTR